MTVTEEHRRTGVARLFGPDGPEEVLVRAVDRRPVSRVRTDDLVDHHRRYAAMPGVDPAGLLATVEEVGLGGRGGAFFPVVRKWRTARRASADGRSAVVVGNGAESEPASAKDTVLLGLRPHLVLDGLAATAAAVGADRTVLWLHANSGVVGVVEQAAAERRAAGAGGPEVEVRTAPPGYLTGEASAVVRGLTEGVALPTFRRRPSAVSGVDGRPTVVHNVETLARVGLLARWGVAGDADEVLVTVLDDRAGPDARLAVRVLPGGGVVADALGGPAPRAVLLGGYGGAWLPWSEVADRRLGEAAGGSPEGGSLGAGVLVPLAPDRCGVTATADAVRYLADARAGQCGPCHLGTPAIADLWAAVAAGSARARDVRRLKGYAAEVEGRGACALPDAVTSLTVSALRVLADDVAVHASRRRCRLRHDLVLPGTRSGVVHGGR